MVYFRTEVIKSKQLFINCVLYALHSRISVFCIETELNSKRNHLTMYGMSYKLKSRSISIAIIDSISSCRTSVYVSLVIISD